MNKRLASMLTALALTMSPVATFAADFTPSAETNSAPEVVGTVEVSNPVIQQGIEMGVVEVVVTPVADRNDSDTLPEIKDALQQTLDEAKKTDVENLAPGITEAFNEAKDKNPGNSHLTINDLKVADIFDVSLVANGDTVLDVDGSISFQVQTNLRPGDVFIVLHDKDGNMEVVPAHVDDKGVLTITTTSLSPFIILVADDAQSSVTPGNPSNPGTDNPSVTPGTPGTDNKPSTDTNKPSTDTNKPTNTPAKPGTGNVENTGVTKPSTGTTSTTTEAAAPATSDVATAANSNSMMAGVGVAAGLAGILLVLKARKGLAK